MRTCYSSKDMNKVVSSMLSQLYTICEEYNMTKVSLKAMKNDGTSFGGLFHFFKTGRNEQSVANFLETALIAEANLYRCINQLKYKAVSYTIEDVLIGKTRCIIFDIDNVPDYDEQVKIIKKLKSKNLLPRSYSHTRNGLHLAYYTGNENYLRVSDYKDLHKGFRSILNEITGVPCDNAVSNIAGLIRLPESPNFKTSEPFITKTIYVDHKNEFVFALKKVANMIDAFNKIHDIKEPKIKIIRLHNSNGSINPVNYEGCQTVEDVLKRIEHVKITTNRNESMSARYIADILNLNGIKICKSSVAIKLKRLLEEGLIKKTRDSVFDMKNKANNRSAEYALSTSTIEKVEIPKIIKQFPVYETPTFNINDNSNIIKEIIKI